MDSRIPYTIGIVFERRNQLTFFLKWMKFLKLKIG
jgi:hypothetical protein